MNVAFITGSLGADMEVSFTSNNTAIGKFSVATSDGYKDRDNNWVDKTTWHNATLFKPKLLCEERLIIINMKLMVRIGMVVPL